MCMLIWRGLNKQTESEGTTFNVARAEKEPPQNIILDQKQRERVCSQPEKNERRKLAGIKQNE